MIHGTISLLNFAVRKVDVFFLLSDIKARNPEIKNNVGIKNVSSIILIIPTISFVAGSSTIQKEAHVPLLS